MRKSALAATGIIQFVAMIWSATGEANSPPDSAVVTIDSLASWDGDAAEHRQVTVSWPNDLMLAQVTHERWCSWLELDPESTTFEIENLSDATRSDSERALQVLRLSVENRPTRLGDYCSTFVTVTLDQQGFDAPKVEQFHFVEVFDPDQSQSRFGRMEEVIEQRRALYIDAGFEYVAAGGGAEATEQPLRERTVQGVQIYRDETPDPRDIPEDDDGYPSLSDLAVGGR